MTIFIILITCGLSIYGFSNPYFVEKYIFNPYKINRDKEYYRFISYGFFHADPMHLGFNMISLYFIGSYVEMIFAPSFVYVLFYILALIVSTIPDFIKNKNNPYYSALGASGAVSAALFALLLLSPWGKVYVFFAIPIPFIIYAVLFLYFSFKMSKKNIDNIGHLTHLTGAIFGIVASILWVPDILPDFIQLLINPPSLAEFFQS